MQIFQKCLWQNAAATLVLAAVFTSFVPANASQDEPAQPNGTVSTKSLNQIYATAPDGVQIAIQEFGNPFGAEVILVHGLLGSHLDWSKQIDSKELKGYRIITYDMRGHGLSGKPNDPVFYTEGKRWGDDLNAVISATHAKHPVVVGWSLAGASIINYVQQYGDKNLAGIYFVASVTSLRPEFLVPQDEVHQLILSPDLAQSLRGIKDFLHLCFEIQPDTSDFELLYANAARASSTMLTTIFTKGLDIPSESALPDIKVPSEYIYGKDDALVGRKSFEFAKQLVPQLNVHEFPGTGHAPFFEKPEKFNEDLRSFVQECTKASVEK